MSKPSGSLTAEEDSSSEEEEKEEKEEEEEETLGGTKSPRGGGKTRTGPDGTRHRRVTAARFGQC